MFAASSITIDPESPRWANLLQPLPWNTDRARRPLGQAIRLRTCPCHWRTGISMLLLWRVCRLNLGCLD